MALIMSFQFSKMYEVVNKWCPSTGLRRTDKKIVQELLIHIWHTYGYPLAILGVIPKIQEAFSQLFNLI